MRRNPFGAGRNGYVWWVVDGPALLQGVLEQTDPALAKSVKDAGLWQSCQRYGHILAGIYMDNENNKAYFIVGAPSAYKKDIEKIAPVKKDIIKIIWVTVKKDTLLSTAPDGYWLLYYSV
jgi:hypothetical protein